MARPSPRLLIPITIAAGLGLGGWYLDAQRARARGTLSGFFESQPVTLASRVGGRVSRILVQEGDAVNTGQALIEFEAEAVSAEARSREATAEGALQRLREVAHGPRAEEILRQRLMVAELEAALLKLRNGPLPEEIAGARDRLRRAEAGYRKTLAGSRPQEIEEARAAEAGARAKLAQAERGLTPEERSQLRDRAEAARAQEELARKELDRTQALYRDDAVSRQQLDRARTEVTAAAARRADADEAVKRAEAGTPQAELDQARAALRQAEAALALAQAGARTEDIDAARADVAGARDSLRLLQRGTRPEDIQAAQARLEQARAALSELERGSRAEEVQQARAATRAAEATANGAVTNLRERVLRAPRPGIVERLLVARGDLTIAGAPAIRMSDPGDLWMRVYVPEAKLSLVSRGDSADLTVDGTTGSVQAVVESIATRGEFTPANLQTPDDRGKQVFAVRLRLAHPDPRVKAGMYATVRRLGRIT